MTKPHRQRYGLGSIIKKAAKAVKKVVKSPLGKTAILGGLGAWGLGSLGGGTGWGRFAPSAMKAGLSRITGGGLPFDWANKAARNKSGGGIWDWITKNKGRSALLGLGAAGTLMPFFAGKPDEEEEEEDWSVTPSSIANIRNMARLQDPSLAFLPNQNYVQPGFYAAGGGIARLANGGGPAEAQAEQMLKMEYQKYRNQGGTMSYQQFKMAVLQQAQAQGPMAHKRGRVDGPGGYAGINLADYFSVDDLDILRSHKYDPYEVLRWRDKGKNLLATLRMAQGGRVGYQGGELVEDESMMAATPTGMMEENIEEVQGEPTREQLEVLAMEIFQLRLEELDEEQLMVVYQAAMEQQPQEEMMQEEAVQLAAQGGRIGKEEGGLMSLGGMEKDYRNEGGFVALGKEEKADDVPARLSKNEFVFTADAVRNAGGGDIDVGAEVMQNMMKNLEAGGQISEESQGAQGMYDNMKQLETRIA